MMRNNSASDSCSIDVMRSAASATSNALTVWPKTLAVASLGVISPEETARGAGNLINLDSSLRDVKQDESNNEVAPSRGDEQIDDVLDGLVGAVVGGFKSAVWAILRIRTAVEAAVGKWSAQPFVEEQK